MGLFYGCEWDYKALILFVFSLLVGIAPFIEAILPVVLV